MAKKEEGSVEEFLDPKDVYEDKIIKTVRIQQVKGKNRQSFYIRIPMEIVNELEIKKGDKFTFEVDLKNNQKYFRLGGK